MNLESHKLVSAVAMALLHSLWQIALLALLATLGFVLLRRASASLRHTMGLVFQLGMLAVPLSSFAYLWQAPDFVEAAPVRAMLAFIPQPIQADPVFSWSDWVLAGLGLLWPVGVAVMAVLQFGGWRLLRRMEGHDYAPLPAPWQDSLKSLCCVLGIARPVAVRLGCRVAAPFTAYVLRPVIWLPAQLPVLLPREQVESLLAHELAHVRRLDWIWNLLQTLVESLLFYHPAMWWLGRRVREEREHACDVMAAAACGDPISLAEALAGLQRRRIVQRRMAPLARLGLAAEGGVLRRRITHLLGGRMDGRDGRATAALLPLCVLCAALAAMVGPSHSLLINLHTEGMTGGPLAPGDYREFRARYVFDKPRMYRVSVDPDGALRETYVEGGVQRPIGADARRWIAAMADMAQLEE